MRHARLPRSANIMPLFVRPELEGVRAERAALMHKLAHVRLEARSRIRIEQKVAMLTARIMRLEGQIGGAR